MIRDVTAADRDALTAFFKQAQDYIRLETGHGPDAETLQDFLTGAPPGADPADSDRLGLWQGPELIGITEQGYGFPEAGDPYIGLMLLAPQARGQGHGPALLNALSQRARARGATRQFLAVLDANPRARNFWQAQGFRIVKTGPPQTQGPVTHIRHRMMRAL